MKTKNQDDSVIEKIVLGNNFVSKNAVHTSRDFRDQHHPDKDLADILFLKGHLTRARLALVRRLVKMNSRGDSAALRKPTGISETASATKMPPPVSKDPDSNGADQGSKSGDSTSDKGKESKRATPGTDTDPLPAVDASQSETQLLKPGRGPSSLHKCGRYELVSKIARGGMGVIYRARHPDLDKEFAVKVLSEGVDAPEESIERFRREAKAAARLDHHGIVRVYDFGTEDGFPYLVMDFVEGRPLDEIIKDEGVTPRRASQIAMALAEALHHAHKQGLIHRDIKPSNVLVDSEGRCLITDFGIVKELSGDTKLTRTGYTLGSPCYMSPEQAVGDHDQVGPASDMYSLGATLYEMLTGEPPFNGDSIHAIMHKVVEDDPESPRKYNPAVPIDLEAICLKALEKEISQRYQDAMSFLEDISNHLKGEPVSAKPPSLVSRARRAMSRNKLAATLLFLLLSTVVIFVGMFVGIRLSARGERLAKAQGLVEQADASLSAINDKQSEADIRHHYFDAITFLAEALRLNPSDREVKRQRQETIVKLGDRLVEGGLTEFAEFVYRMHDDFQNNPELQKKIQVTRQQTWIAAAEKQTQAGQIEEAILTYQAGIIQLEQAGYKATTFKNKVETLKALLNEKSRRLHREALLKSGAKLESEGDLIKALNSFNEAKSLGDSEGMIQERIERLQKSLGAQVSVVLDKALTVRRRYETTYKPGPFSKQHQSKMAKRIAEGEGLETAAKTQRHDRQFKRALDSAEQALEAFKAANLIASAAAEKDKVFDQKAKAQEAAAKKFAPKDFARGVSRERDGDAFFERGEYRKALLAFRKSAAAFALAVLLGEGKGVVAESRRKARQLGEEALQKLPASVVPKAFKRARKLEDRGNEAYQGGHFDRAQEHYQQASKLFQDVLKKAPIITEAYKQQRRAHEEKKKSDELWGSLYGGDFHNKGNEALQEGDAQFNFGNYIEATSKYESAIFRFGRAQEKSATTAKSRKKAEQAQARMEEARNRAIKAQKTESYAYQRGEKDRTAGLSAANRGYWSGAYRHWSRALRAYYEALGIR